MVEMLRFNVKHQRMDGVVLNQRAVALVTLGHKMLSLGIPTCVGSQDRNLCSHVMGGFQPSGPQHMCRHGRGSGLAVHPADDDSLLAGHHGGKDLGAAGEPLA